LKVVSQTGGSKLPAQDSEWSSEIALDVEWAHAMAPGANILLVEASSDHLKDLLAGVNYARNAPGVSVVSLSWGGGEWNGETSYDSYFTTPAGHTGVTFVNACGDLGAGNIQWPASSPNVLSVGGTTLSVTNSAGGHGSETGWKSTSGGTSPFEKMPLYQQGLPHSDTSYTTNTYHWSNGQTSTSTTSDRSIPDVAYDANPGTGFAVYDSVPYHGVSGWQVAGGTSAGAPQWSALIAIANQGRVLAGNAPLDGATNTLPLLYGTYANPGTSQYPSYASTMNDVTSGGSYFVLAGPGYDQVTGLGTPRVLRVIFALGGKPLIKPGTEFGPSLQHPGAGGGSSSNTGSGSTDTSNNYGSGGTASPGGTPPSQTPGTAGGGTNNHQPTPAEQHATSTGTQTGTGTTRTSGNQPGGAPAATPLPSVGPSNYRNPGNASAVALANAASPVQVVAVSGSATTAVGRVAVAGQSSPAAYVPVSAEAVLSAAPVKGLSAASSMSVLAAVSGLSIWSRLSSLLGGGNRIEIPPADSIFHANLPWMRLGLAPAPVTLLNSDGHAWEVTAGVCLGVALAGYWYSSATPVEERTKSLKSVRLRRVRDGWQLTPVREG
jgi:hypothetical protein